MFFYGVIAPVSQDNQKNITEDLFCAQIRVISNVTLIDRRNKGLAEKFNALSDEEIASLTNEELFNLIPHDEELKSKENSIMKKKSGNVLFLQKTLPLLKLTL